jgi:hypothetical protein
VAGAMNRFPFIPALRRFEDEFIRGIMAEKIRLEIPGEPLNLTRLFHAVIFKTQVQKQAVALAAFSQ